MLLLVAKNTIRLVHSIHLILGLRKLYIEINRIKTQARARTDYSFYVGERVSARNSNFNLFVDKLHFFRDVILFF